MKKSGPRIAIISVLLVGMFIFGGVYYVWNTSTDIFKPATSSGTGKIIPLEISPGETTAQIADDLQEKGLIRNAVAFRIWARVKGLDTHLEAGIYNKLNSGMTISDIIDQLLNAQPDAIRVTILEGWRLEQIAKQFSSAGIAKFSAKDFLNYTKHIDRFPDAGKYPLLRSVPQGNSMEGLLFPDSYQVPVRSTTTDVVDLMLTTMSQRINQYHLDVEAQQHKLNIYQMFILASIVEREAGNRNNTADRAGISSVYWNRIYKQNDETVGFLQADPTVQYARDSQNPPSKYWLPLNDSGGNIAKDSQWNTYVRQGFPPSPICSPGLASLQSAAAPANSDYYYFLSAKDGHVVFAKTNAEFEQDKQKYLS